MENWEKQEKLKHSYYVEVIQGTMTPAKWIDSVVITELESAKQEGKREERTEMEVFLNNRAGKDYTSLHQNNNKGRK